MVLQELPFFDYRVISKSADKFEEDFQIQILIVN